MTINQEQLDQILSDLRNNTIHTLNLFDQDLTTEQVIQIAQALKTNTTLTSLDLWDNQIGDEGAIALAEALKTNTTLTSLDLDSYIVFEENQISQEILDEINGYLARNGELAQALGVKGAIAETEHLPSEIAGLAMEYAVDFEITPEMRRAITSEEQRLREERRPRSSSGETPSTTPQSPKADSAKGNGGCCVVM